MRQSSLLTLAAMAALAACASDNKAAADSSRSTATAGSSAAAAPSSAPSSSTATAGSSVTIVRPSRGATTGQDVTVTLRSQGVTIAKADGKKAEGVGHYHLLLDTVPTADNTVIPPTSRKIVHIGTGDSTYTFKGLPAGPHTIIAVIGYGDHTPMPGRRDTVNFTVKQ